MAKLKTVTWNDNCDHKLPSKVYKKENFRCATRLAEYSQAVAACDVSYMMNKNLKVLFYVWILVQGDAGAPFVKLQGGTYYLVGILIHFKENGTPCENPHFPILFLNFNDDGKFHFNFKAL